MLENASCVHLCSDIKLCTLKNTLQFLRDFCSYLFIELITCSLINPLSASGPLLGHYMVPLSASGPLLGRCLFVIRKMHLQQIYAPT